MKFLDNIGQAFGSFQRAVTIGRHGDRRPEFLSDMATASRWQGGDMANQDAAQRRAMVNSWAYTAVEMIARDVSGVANLQVVDMSSGEPKQIKNHPLEQVLRRPNPYMSRSYLWQYTALWLQLSGDAYWYMGRSATGELCEIWVIPSNAVTVVPGDKDHFVSYYQYQAGGMIYRIPACDICHFMLPNPFDVYRGLSPLSAALLAIDSDTEMARWNGGFFGTDNVVPSAIINLTPGNDNQRFDSASLMAIKNDLRENYGASKRKTIITSALNVSVNQLGWSQKDMDFLGGRQFTKDEIFSVYGIPGGLMDKSATEANATTAKAIFRDNVIYPLLVLIAEQVTSDIIAPEWGRQYEAQFEDIRIPNRVLELQEVTAAQPYLTINEIRKRYWKLPPLPDGNRTIAELAPQQSLMPADTTEPPAKGINLKSAELDAWRDKSIKSVKQGKSANVPFVSAHIPTQTENIIRDGLDCAQNTTDIKAVFADAKKGLITSWRPWSAWESRLYNMVLQRLTEQANDIRQRVQNSEQATLSDPEYWREWNATTGQDMGAILSDLATSATRRVADSITPAIETNWNLANDNATSWARTHAAELMDNITQNTQSAIQQQLADWTQANEGHEQLVQRIMNITDENGSVFGEVRARRIATTEATNTYATANSNAWAAAGYAPAAYKPAAHVNCRCYLQPYKTSDGQRVMVWYTARDERVCIQPLTTPWGKVDGCRDLHKTIVSEGPLMGKKV